MTTPPTTVRAVAKMTFRSEPQTYPAKHTERKHMPTTRKVRSSIGANFIRASPVGRPVAEVVTAAKAKGIEITAKHVYQVRSRMKAAAASKNGKHTRGRVKFARADVEAARNVEQSLGAVGQGPEYWERQLREAVAELGLNRATQLLAEMRDRLVALERSFRESFTPTRRKPAHRASAHAN